MESLLLILEPMFYNATCYEFLSSDEYELSEIAEPSQIWYYMHFADYLQLWSGYGIYGNSENVARLLKRTRFIKDLGCPARFRERKKKLWESARSWSTSQLWLKAVIP